MFSNLCEFLSGVSLGVGQKDELTFDIVCGMAQSEENVSMIW